jgi:hypothetical protein
MTLQTKESKSIGWILLPVLIGLLVSAIVGLQLFQDGSSYLLEMLIDRSAVRHGRVSILLFQYPTIFLIKTFHRLEVDTLVTLPIVRLAFNLNYALTPFVSLVFSWLVLRKKKEGLFIWAALIILFVNLVNFSWVSELLIAVQLSCPLLLALLQNPRSKTFWSLFFFLTPFIFFLHPLVITIYIVLAAASAYIGDRQPAYRSSARLSTVLFLLAAALRGIYSLSTLGLYEVSLMASGETANYFVTSRLENILFLGTAIEIAFFILLSQSILQSRMLFMKLVFWFVSLQLSLLLLLTARFLLRGNLSPLVFMGCIGIPVFMHIWISRTRTSMEKTQLLYGACVFLAVAASSLIMAQYASAERLFTLKTGLDLFVVLLIMTMAVMDSMRDLMHQEYVWRFRLVIALSIIFAGVMIAKSTMWRASVHKLEQTLEQTDDSCAERGSTDFGWLQNSPYTMINNWSLPSLALVMQDQQPRKLLLESNDCQLFYQSGMVQVDPWSRFSKEYIVPPLE